MKKIYLLLSVFCTIPFICQAQTDDTPEALRDFSGFADIMPGYDDDSMVLQIAPSRRGKDDIIPFIKSAISDTAAMIISDPEQTFCYQVEKRTAKDQRYTLNGFAINGFCGELDKGATATTYSALFTQSPNILTQSSQCRIEPKLMIRFVRGVDYADVLLSSPCPSFTVFYAGKYKSFNIKQGIIDDIIKQLSTNIETFHSPALIQKTVANGEPASADESEMLQKKQREQAQQLSTTEDDEKPQPTKPKTGWGNLNLKLKKTN